MARGTGPTQLALSTAVVRADYINQGHICIIDVTRYELSAPNDLDHELGICVYDMSDVWLISLSRRRCSNGCVSLVVPLSYVRVQNWRNQQEITSKQRADINEMERVTSKSKQEDTSNKWKV